MDKLEQRRAEVRRLRAEIAKDMEEARERLNPAQLFDDFLDIVDSKRRFLARVQSGIERNPLVAVLLIAGAAWLISDRSGRQRRSTRRLQLEKTSENNNHKGDYDDSESNDSDQWPYLGDQQIGARPE